MFTASYAAANQAKSIGTLDLREPAGRDALLSIAAGADVLASAGFLQLAEMTRFAGRPPAATGMPDYPGPEPTRRLYRAADGWIAIAAMTGEQATALLAVTGTADPSGLRSRPRLGPDGLAGALAEAFATRPAGYWLALLAEYDVPACPVIERAKALRDPRLDAEYTHVVRDPRIGRLRLARGSADWAAAGPAGDSPAGESPAGDSPAGDSPAGDSGAADWRQRATDLLATHGTRYEPYRLD